MAQLLLFKLLLNSQHGGQDWKVVSVQLIYPILSAIFGGKIYAKNSNCL